MSFKWQNEHMERFLKIYKNHECLWNNKNSDYNKPSAREIAYNSLTNELNLPGVTLADVKAKIKTIRTRYSTEVAKVLRSEKKVQNGECEEIFEPRLFWFKIADDFLRPVVSSSKKKDEEHVSASTFNDSQMSDDIKHSTFLDLNGPKEEQLSSENISTIEKVETHHNSTSFAKTPKKRKTIFENSDNDNLNRNEFDIFCESLAFQLKRMPLERALICQQNLQNVMTQERLFQIESYNYCHQEQPPTRSGSPCSEKSSSTLAPPAENCYEDVESENQDSHLDQTEDNVDKPMNEIKMET